MASAAVVCLLAGIGHAEPLEPEIMDYICSIIDDPEPESSLDVLISVLGDCVRAFEALDSEQQARLVLQLLDDAKTPCEEGDTNPTSCSTADDAGSVQAVVAALRQANLQCHEAAEACADITNTCAASGSSASSSSSKQEPPDVGPLQELAPAGISARFLQHCLQHNLHGDLEAAANWLLETDPAQLLRQQQAWERDMQQWQLEREEVEQQKKMQKRLIVEKFDLRAVSASSAGAKKGGRQQQVPDLLPKQSQQQDSKLRYRDGRVVSTKGEKVIIEKVGEDWDGGSRGKVYTKGKRGKGFH